MPTQAALDIVNSVFAGQKDISDYVANALQTTAVDAIDAKKQEIGKQMFNPNAPEEENPEEETPTAEAQPETPEETTDETDQGGDWIR